MIADSRRQRATATHRRGGHASRLGGVVGNARLTTLTAAALLVLLAAEGATLISLQRFVTWHVYLGMLLVPVVALKIASTAYRMLRYYTGGRAYVEAGPPGQLLRLLGPIVVVSTTGLFVTGVALAVVGPSGPGLVLGLHKASFVVWVGALGLHVLAHLLPLPRTLTDEARGRGASGSRLRLGLVAAVITSGAILATATLPLAAPWAHAVQFEH